MIDRFFFTQMVPLLHASIYICDENGAVDEVIQGNDKVKPDSFKDIVGRMEKENPVVEVDSEGLAVCSMWYEPERKFVVLGRVCIYGHYSKDNVYVPYCPKEEYVSIVLIIWKLLTGMELGRNELWSKNIESEENVVRMLTNNVFRFQEERVPYISYLQELKECESIRRGDIEGLKESINGIYEGEYGKTSSDPVRNRKNIAVYIIGAAARSAIEGGVNPEMAYIMRDTYIRNIEENIDDPIRIECAARDAEMAFAKEVRGIKSRGDNNPLIMQVKDYVFEHIHDNIFIRDIAKFVGVSPNYLSEQFSRHEGISLKQYIINEKVKSSEYMLKYTDYSLQEISSVYAFSSQSRFSVYFQRINGVTPAKYRKNFVNGGNDRKAVENV